MTTVNHQCYKCLATVWLQEIEDGEDQWRGSADADCGCNSSQGNQSDWNDDDE